MIVNFKWKGLRIDSSHKKPAIVQVFLILFVLMQILLKLLKSLLFDVDTV